MHLLICPKDDKEEPNRTKEIGYFRRKCQIRAHLVCAIPTLASCQPWAFSSSISPLNDAQMVAAADNAPVIAMWTPDEKKGSTKSVRFSFSIFYRVGWTPRKRHTCGIPDYTIMVTRVSGSEIAIVCGAFGAARDHLSFTTDKVPDAW